MLLDVQDREGRGADACRAAREMTDAPLVAFTSFMTPELWSDVRKAGAIDYLLKHVDTERLAGELVRLAKRRRASPVGLKV